MSSASRNAPYVVVIQKRLPLLLQIGLGLAKYFKRSASENVSLSVIVRQQKLCCGCHSIPNVCNLP